MREDYLTERYMRLPDGSFPHLGVKGEGDVASVALLSGSPGRVELMAEALDNVTPVGGRRGYLVYSGHFEGTYLTIATSGVGSPSLSIAMEELGACGTTTFIRVGSCAAIDEELPVGGVMVAYAAVKDEGTSMYYAPPNFPAAASPRVTDALVSAAADVGLALRVGLTRSTDSFYEGERKTDVIDRWRPLGVLTFEMETSALFTVASARGWEAGSILVAGSNLITKEATYQGQRVEEYQQGQRHMIRVALRAAAQLAKNREAENTT